jgi:hypothetical protein
LPGFAVRFRVVSDDGAALSGIPIAVRGKQVGKTDQGGELDALVNGGEGETLSIGVQCGSEYRQVDPLPSLRLTRTKRIVGGSSPPGIPYDTTCVRRRRNVAIVARADDLPGIPVAVEGKVVAFTDADGNAHVLVPLDADVSVLHVGFETSNRPELQPKSPGRAFDIAPSDDLVTLEQKFTVAPKPSPHRFQAQPKHVPVRID